MCLMRLLNRHPTRDRFREGTTFTPALAYKVADTIQSQSHHLSLDSKQQATSSSPSRASEPRGSSTGSERLSALRLLVCVCACARACVCASLCVRVCPRTRVCVGASTRQRAVHQTSRGRRTRSHSSLSHSRSVARLFVRTTEQPTRERALHRSHHSHTRSCLKKAAAADTNKTSKYSLQAASTWTRAQSTRVTSRRSVTVSFASHSAHVRRGFCLWVRG